MKKKISLAIVFLMVISALNSAVFAAGSRINALYFTKMTMQQSGGSNMDMLAHLYDNNVGDAYAVAFAKAKSAEFTEADCIDMHLSRQSAVESIVFWVRSDRIANQGLSKVRIDYMDETDGTYKTAVDNYELSYNDKEATVAFEANIVTSKFKIYFQGAPREWGNIRLDELYAVGTPTGEKINNGNLLYNASVTPVTVPSDWRISGINDGTIEDALLSEYTPSEENPYIIDFDFGADMYNVTGIDIITQYPVESGIRAAKLKYYDDGAWQTAQNISFPRTARLDKNDAYDEVNLSSTALSSKFRLEITDAAMTWGTFRINELIFKGTKFVPENVGIGGLVTTTASGDIEANNITDGDEETSVTVSAPSYPEVFDILYNKAIIETTGMAIVSADESVKNVDIEYLSSSGMKTLKSDLELEYSDGKASIDFGEKITTSKIRVKVNGATGTGFKINEIPVYGKKTEAVGKKVSALYFTPMQTNVGDQGFNDLRKFGDGYAGMYNTVVLSKNKNEAFTANDYIEIYNTYKSYVNGIYMAIINNGMAYDNQRISKVRIDALNDETGKWETLVDNYDVDYVLGTGKWDDKTPNGSIYEANIVFPKTVSATNFKIYPTEAVRTWNNIMISEMYTYGTTSETGVVNNGNLLYNNVTVTAESIDMKNNLNKGYIGWPGLSAKIPSETEPYNIDFDFGNKWYSVDEIELITQFPNNSGIEKGSFKYYTDNGYVTAKKFDFKRTVPSDAVNHYFVANDARDVIKFELPMKSNKFRIEITEAMLTWGKFRINEVIFRGKEITEEMAKNAADEAYVYTTLKSADSLSNLTDSNAETTFTAHSEGNEIIELYMTNKAAEISKILFAGGESAPKNIKAEAYTGGKWQTIAENTALEYTDGKAEIVLESAVKTSRVRLTVGDTGTISLGSINLLGSSQAYARSIGTANQAPNAEISTDAASETPVSYLNDGNDETIFVSAEKPQVEFKMPGYFGLDKIVIKSDDVTLFDLKIKDENGAWITILDNCINTAGEYLLPQRTVSKDFKIAVTKSGDNVSIKEIELVGECCGRYPLSIKIADVARTSEVVTVSADITNIQAKSEKAIVIAAVYEKTSGKLLGVENSTVSLGNYETARTVIRPAVSLEHDEITVKAFAFENLGSILPSGVSDIK